MCRTQMESASISASANISTSEDTGPGVEALACQESNLPEAHRQGRTKIVFVRGTNYKK